MARIETFLDFEASLGRIVDRVWTEKAGDALPALTDAVLAKDGYAANRVLEELSIMNEVDALLPKVRLIMQASMLFGAEFATGTKVNRTALFKAGDNPLLDSALIAFKGIVTTALQKSVTKNAGAFVGDLMQADHEAMQEVQKDSQTMEEAVRAMVLGQGRMMIDIGANLSVSRLVNFGALYELAAQGYATYQLNATLDEKTSQVCRRMHGKKFSVEIALQQATTALLTTDPAQLRDAAPWIRGNKATLKHLETASAAELQSEHRCFPPFHPKCRTIAVKTGDVVVTGNEYTPIVLPTEPAIATPPPAIAVDPEPGETKPDIEELRPEDEIEHQTIVVDALKPKKAQPKKPKPGDPK